MYAQKTFHFQSIFPLNNNPSINNLNEILNFSKLILFKKTYCTQIKNGTKSQSIKLYKIITDLYYNY
jgi:hypothetical protein